MTNQVQVPDPAAAVALAERAEGKRDNIQRAAAALAIELAALEKSGPRDPAEFGAAVRVRRDKVQAAIGPQADKVRESHAQVKAMAEAADPALLRLRAGLADPVAAQALTAQVRTATTEHLRVLVGDAVRMKDFRLADAIVRVAEERVAGVSDAGERAAFVRSFREPLDAMLGAAPAELRDARRRAGEALLNTEIALAEIRGEPVSAQDRVRMWYEHVPGPRRVA